MSNRIAKNVLISLALLLCAALVFAACQPGNVFTPVEIPAEAEAEGNGGIAVKYGDWIYYVNGYQSSATANNAYTSDVRTGAIVRIKVSDLNDVIAINDQDLTSSEKTESIAKAVAEKAQMVVPNFYYTGNTSSTALNGIYVFNNRIYITTPNNELDINGNVLSSQLVLASYNMGGGDMQRHYVFQSNAPQLKLSQVGEDVYATFVLDGNLSVLKVGESEADVIAEEITTPVFSGDYVYYLDSDGSICRYKTGDAEAKTVVENPSVEDEKSSESYTIRSANGDYVYYTVEDDTQTSGKKLYYANDTKSGEIVLDTVPSGNYYGWQDKVVYTTSVPEEPVTMYGIWVASGDGTDKKEVLDAAQNSSSITFNKLVGDTLYYTANSISYTLDLSTEGAQPVAYAYSLSTSATGWSVPDVLGEYVFSLGSGSVSVVKFNPVTKRNSDASVITFTVIEEDVA